MPELCGLREPGFVTYKKPRSLNGASIYLLPSRGRHDLHRHRVGRRVRDRHHYDPLGRHVGHRALRHHHEARGTRRVRLQDARYRQVLRARLLG
jgi:hypothetical protein